MELIKTAVTRNVDAEYMNLIEEGNCKKGDIILAKVVSPGKFYGYVRGSKAEKIQIKKGDKLLLSLSDRYAARIMEGVVPKHLKKGDVINILEPGGTSGLIKEARSDFDGGKVEFIGFVSKNGKKLNLKDFSIETREIKKLPKLVVSIGVNMESGKTTTSAELVRALTRKGFKVGAGKITGIGNVGDAQKYLNKGAAKTYAIVDAGCPSTYMLSEKELVDILMKIFSNLAFEEPDFVILEIADGILQRETAMLLGNKKLRSYKPEFILNCNDAPGAYGGMLVLKEKHNVKPIFFSGIGAITYLGRKEIENLTGLRAYDSISQPNEMAKHVIKAFRM